MISAIFTALSREMLSGDALYLAFINAEQLAIEHGVPADVAEKFMTQIAAVMDAGRRGNPLSSMF